MACALALALALPALALADEAGAAQPVVVAEGHDYTSGIDAVRIEVDEVSTTLDRTNEKLDKVVEILSEGEDGTSSDRTVELLSSIDEQLVTISGNTSQDVKSVDALAASRDVSVMAYANAPSTGTYATYAAGMLPGVAWDEHYCFVQDSQSSYLFCWGDLSYDSGSWVGQGSWVRWYYSGTSRGYVMESGEGHLSVSANGYCVLSDLGGYPALDSGEQLRKEVGFYAVVAVALHCLSAVWGFLVRLRGSVSV